ncbi:hypothetical protein [Alkalilimnicola ehrlichii]|uniref:hypothetical protein n=1 Tax=Alkalilimnicola ehrlichii TaxID=351052 RepID=UPI0015F29B6D|nr:hypothetical protein [Alkalilimnicola ehrlichii]
MEAPTTTGRITQRHRHATEQIRRELEYRLTYFAEHPDRIDDRLAELDSEWDIERSLMANASTLALVGTALALLGRRRYLLLSVLVSAFCCSTRCRAGVRRCRYCAVWAFGHSMRSNWSVMR